MLKLISRLPDLFITEQLVYKLIYELILQDRRVQRHAPSESTRRTVNPEPLSQPPSSWPWSGSFVRSNTCLSQSAPNSPALSAWPRPRWRSGSRTEERRPSGCRRQSWRGSKWPANPSYIPAWLCRFHSVRRPRQLSCADSLSPSADTCCPLHL